MSVAPSVGHAVGRERARHRPAIDAAFAVSMFLAALYLLPARYVLPGLASIGSPALLLGVALGGWWALGRVSTSIGGARGPQPIRVGLMLMVAVALLSVLFSYDRLVVPAEAAATNRTLASLFGAVGVGLLVADGIDSPHRLRSVVRVLCGLGAFVAVIGVLQYTADVDLVPYLRLPGLVVNGTLATILARDGLPRPASTAGHPIEFGVTMALILPLAIHLVWTEQSRGRRQLALAFAVVITLGALVSLSRSAVLGLVSGGIVLFAGVGWRHRINLLAAAGVVGLAAVVLVPSAVRTLRSLFLRLETDTSITARTDDYAYIFDVVAARPLTGLGFGSYTPSVYRIIDNQYLLQVAETGLIGLGVLLSLLVLGVLVASRVRRQPGNWSLGTALMASLVCAAVSMATFDSLAYRMFTGTLMLVLGLSGAAWRLGTPPDADPR